MSSTRVCAFSLRLYKSRANVSTHTLLAVQSPRVHPLTLTVGQAPSAWDGHGTFAFPDDSEVTARIAMSIFRSMSLDSLTNH